MIDLIIDVVIVIDAPLLLTITIALLLNRKAA